MLDLLLRHDVCHERKTPKSIGCFPLHTGMGSSLAKIYS